jgi:hypothetical protein
MKKFFLVCKHKKSFRLWLMHGLLLPSSFLRKSKETFLPIIKNGNIKQDSWATPKSSFHDWIIYEVFVSCVFFPFPSWAGVNIRETLESQKHEIWKQKVYGKSSFDMIKLAAIEEYLILFSLFFTTLSHFRYVRKYFHP